MASFSSSIEPSRIATGAPFAATIEQTTVSFGFPPVCNDYPNNRLHGPINLLGCYAAFSAVSSTVSISQACCRFLFVLLRFIFPPILLSWRGAVLQKRKRVTPSGCSKDGGLTSSAAAKIEQS